MAQKRSEADRAPASRSRVQQSREVDERQNMEYYTPSNRITVPTHPDYVYRWVAEYVNGTYMTINVQKQLQDGYERVSMATLPEDFLLFDPTDIRSVDDGHTRFGGLILMRMPRARHESRTRYYQDQSKTRVGSANSSQGIDSRDAVVEDRGSRTLHGEDAARALATLNQA